MSFIKRARNLRVQSAEFQVWDRDLYHLMVARPQSFDSLRWPQRALPTETKVDVDRLKAKAEPLLTQVSQEWSTVMRTS
jgi:hypothetical protein